MKRSIFLLVVANLTLAFVIYLSFRNRTPKFENFENLIVETISNLEEISIEQPERKLSVIIKRNNYEWQLTKPVLWPVEQLVYSNFITKLAHIRPLKIATIDEIEDRGERIYDYGIDENSTQLKLKGNGNQLSIFIGNIARDEESVFICTKRSYGIPDSIWKVSREIEEIAVADSEKWAVSTFVETPFSGLDKLSIEFHSERNSSSITSLYKDKNNWFFDKPFNAEANLNKVSSLLNQIISFNLQFFETTKKGVSINEVLGIKLMIEGSGGTEIINFYTGKNLPDQFLVVKKNNSKTKFIIEKSFVELLSDWSTKLRERKILSLDPQRIDFIHYTNKDTSLKLDRLENNEWMSTESNQTNNETVIADFNTIQKLIQSLNRIEVDKFLSFNPNNKETMSFMNSKDIDKIKFKFVNTSEISVYLSKTSDDTSLWRSYIPEKNLISLLKIPWLETPTFKNIYFRNKNLTTNRLISVWITSLKTGSILQKQENFKNNIYLKADKFIGGDFNKEGAWVGGDWVPWKCILNTESSFDQNEKFYLSEKIDGTRWYGGSKVRNLIFNLDTETVEWLGKLIQFEKVNN